MFTKHLILFSLFTLPFFNSLKRTYVEAWEGVHIKQTGTNKGIGGQKSEVLNKRTF